MIPIAFYAPLKSPDHPVPSGDRAMARLLLQALHGAGFAPTLASELRSLDLAGDEGRQRALRAEAEAEADRLVACYRRSAETGRPRLWFTYHCHYKAPDWIGPRVADALAIPYVVAEGSRSVRRAFGPWAVGHAGAELALRRADRLLVMTQRDAEDLAPALRPGQRIVDLPPFLDASRWTPLEGDGPDRRGDRPLRLLAAAMMRPGDKLASYRLLADALALLPVDTRWTLDVVGDGPAREDVEAALAPHRSRVRRRGALADQPALAEVYRAADLLVWPAVGEAYGMALLEAHACGCPVLAGREGGVESVVRDGETGSLVAPRNPAALAAALYAFIADPSPLAAMRTAARRFVETERDVAHASTILRDEIRPLLATRPHGAAA